MNNNKNNKINTNNNNIDNNINNENNQSIILYQSNKLKKSKINNFIEKTEKIVDIIFNNFSKYLSLIGPFFVFAFLSFFFISFHNFLFNLIPYWFDKENLNYFFSPILFLLIFPFYIITFFFLIFNYILSIIIKPGELIDIINSKKFKIINPYYTKLINLSYILKENNINKNCKFPFSFCKYCNNIKPLRTHHCNVCNKCIFKMDHHCPWINNCVGQNNYRYFILFLYHLWILCILNSIMSLFIFFFDNNYFIDKKKDEFIFVTVLNLCGVVICNFFNIYYWWRVLKNDTSIEFWGRRIKNKSHFIKEYNLGNYKSNLFITFGKKNLFKILYTFDIKSLNLSGLEWSRMIDKNFLIKEIKEPDPFFEEEEKINI